MENIKQFIEVSSIPAELIQAVIRQFGGWESFKEDADSVSNHGIDAGYHGFVYYTDTVAFCKRNKKAIISYAKQMADDIGDAGIISLLASFGCLKGDTQDDIADGLYNPCSDMRTTVYNALAWFTAEEVCRAYIDALYDMENN